ncbi:MAG: FHA domain-containing protein [Planctomycetaceae bacterium]|nr:FHA domain-containing protein [Planctomycetaceae bacterium]
MSAATTLQSDAPRTLPVSWQLLVSPGRGETIQTIDIDAIRFRVGRRDTADYKISSLQVSGLHAEFVQVGIRLFVRDMNSTNGTYVNGKRIDNRDYALRDHDRVRLSNVEFIVHRKRADEAVADTAVMEDTALETLKDTNIPLPSLPQA